eukprot:scaffold8402_cov209-Skeletonema_marinoi.AAC.3
MAFVREGALMSDEMRNHVSHHNGSGSVGKRKRRKKKRYDKMHNQLEHSGKEVSVCAPLPDAR